MVSCCWCGLRGRLWIGLQGETGGNMVIHPAAAREEQPFFDIIISVITYEAIKQTSLPISSAAGLFPVLVPSRLPLSRTRSSLSFFLSFWFNLSPNSSFLLLILPSHVTPDEVSISAYWLSHCRLYACLTLTGTRGTSNTHHPEPIALPHVSAALFVCRGDEGIKCLLRWESGRSYTGENPLAPKEQKIAMLLFLTPH